jgi:hypothetical protein
LIFADFCQQYWKLHDRSNSCFSRQSLKIRHVQLRALGIFGFAIWWTYPLMSLFWHASFLGGERPRLIFVTSSFEAALIRHPQSGHEKMHVTLHLLDRMSDQHHIYHRSRQA